MASKKQEDMLLNNILRTAGFVREIVGDDLSAINERVKEMLSEFAEETKSKIVLGFNEDGILISSVVDMKSDYVRTRFNTDETMLSLKAKLYNVPMDIKVAKGDDIFTNKEVSDALLELSKIVLAMPVEMTKVGKDDWSRDLGAMPKSLAGNAVTDTVYADEEPNDAVNEVQNEPDHDVTEHPESHPDFDLGLGEFDASGDASETEMPEQSH